MVTIKFDNPAVTGTTTTLATAAAMGDTTLQVSATTGFAANGFVLIEDVGHQYCELKKISSVGASSLVLTSALDLAHTSATLVTLLSYNQWEIKKSVDGGATYALLASGPLNYATMWNQIEYEYLAYSLTDYYQIYYQNTQTSVETLAATQTNVDAFGWITVSDIRSETGITADDIADAVFIRGIQFGAEWIKDKAYNQRVISSSAPDRTFDLDIDVMELGDWATDGVIDKHDFIIYIEDEKGTQQFVSHLVKEIFPFNKRVIFTRQLPAAANQRLVFWTPVTFRRHDTIIQALRLVNKLQALNYILSNVPIAKLARGSISWTAGGTTVNLEPNMIQEAIKQNDLIIKNYMVDIQKTYMRTSKLRTESSQFRQSRLGFSFRTPGNTQWRV